MSMPCLAQKASYCLAALRRGFRRACRRSHRAPVFLLEDVDARLQMAEHFFGESAALFKQTLARPEEGGFIERVMPKDAVM